MKIGARDLKLKGLKRALEEQKARLYIIRQCVAILMTWHDWWVFWPSRKFVKIFLCCYIWMFFNGPCQKFWTSRPPGLVGDLAWSKRYQIFLSAQVSIHRRSPERSDHQAWCDSVIWPASVGAISMSSISCSHIVTPIGDNTVVVLLIIDGSICQIYRVSRLFDQTMHVSEGIIYKERWSVWSLQRLVQVYGLFKERSGCF